VSSPQSLRRAIAASAVAHAIAGALGSWALGPAPDRGAELVDIELAPPAPRAEALPPERAPLPAPPPASPPDPAPDPAPAPPPPPAPAAARDAGVDAPADAASDAPADAASDAPADAASDAPADAAQAAPADGGLADAAGAPDAPNPSRDAGGDPARDAATLASAHDAREAADATAGSAAGSGDPAASAGTADPAVDGAPTRAGTAANLLAYFPAGHVTTALIRFDRLRGTEWAAPAERLLRPMPDYRALFGAADARVADKLEAMVISTPAPADAVATTLVARTALPRAGLRDLLGAAAPVSWSAARGGLLGRRRAAAPQDRRVFLSPFRGWFLLAQPADLPGLLAPAPGDLDRVEATARLPAWLAGIRAIEAESGADRGPALVVTIALPGGRRSLGDRDFGLGVAAIPLPERISLAAEVVRQGWLASGNLRFASAEAAAEFVAAAQTAQQRIGDSRLLQAALGKPASRVVANLSLARAGPRVSYATSVSIADMRAILALAALQLDAYFTAARR
jgi:hypothetical protein